MVIAPQGGQHEGLRSLLPLVVVLLSAWLSGHCAFWFIFKGMYLQVVIEGGANTSSVLLLFLTAFCSGLQGHCWFGRRRDAELWKSSSVDFLLSSFF